MDLSGARSRHWKSDFLSIIAPSTGPPVEESVAVSGNFDRGQLVIEPWLDDPMPDDDCGI